MAIQNLGPIREQVAGRTDVLIVGAGPAGCMAAVTLARYGISFRLFDQNATRTQTGHASAFQPRTQEILQTLGLLHKLDSLGHRLTETSFWKPGPTGVLQRVSVGPEVVHPTPFQYMFNTDQGLTEQTFEDDLIRQGHSIDRFMEFIDYEDVSETNAEWPLKVHMKNNVSGANEVWLAKYILGSDGSRSRTRGAIGAKTISNDGQDNWAVADVLVDTDFPDRRRRCAIRTPNGCCMLIPRKDEGMRIFLQLDDDQVAQLDACKALASKRLALGLEHSESFQLLNIIRSQAQRVLSPFVINFTKIVWLSRYKVAQRIVDRFADDSNRAFLLGDACHTHSPKAGQGMNVSISDAYNLTWKLAMVLKGIAHPQLLATYEYERRPIAELLIDFDTKFAKLFGQKDDLDSTTLHDLWEAGHGFASGCAYRYPGGLLVDSETQVKIDALGLEPLVPGKRLLNIPLIRHIDGTITNLLSDLPSNGRFHLMVFAGGLLASDRFDKLSQYLRHPSSPLERFNRLTDDRFHHEDITTSVSPVNKAVVVDAFLIHSDDHLTTELESLPPPFSSVWQSRVYEDKHGLGHQKLGVSQEEGCVLLLRPDGYISKITTFDDVREMGSFLEGFLYPVAR